MKTINKFTREDVADGAVFAVLGAIVITSIEFLITTSILHYITIPILVVEAVAAGVAATIISVISILATDDED